MAEASTTYNSKGQAVGSSSSRAGTDVVSSDELAEKVAKRKRDREAEDARAASGAGGLAAAAEAAKKRKYSAPIEPRKTAY